MHGVYCFVHIRHVFELLNRCHLRVRLCVVQANDRLLPACTRYSDWWLREMRYLCNKRVSSVRLDLHSNETTPSNMQSLPLNIYSGTVVSKLCTGGFQNFTFFNSVAIIDRRIKIMFLILRHV